MSNSTTEERDTDSPNTLEGNPAEMQRFLVPSQVQVLPSALLADVRREVEAVLPKLIPDKIYTLRALCQKSFWDELSNGQRRTAGQCMAYLVQTKQLPLTIAGRSHGNSVLYRLN